MSEDTPDVELIKTNLPRFDALKTQAEKLNEEGKYKKHEKASTVTEKYDAYWARSASGALKYEIQIAKNPQRPVDKMTVEMPVKTYFKTSEDKTEKVEMDVMAMVWKTVKNERGESAVCYKLLKGQGGKEVWVKQSSSEVDRTINKGVETWTLGAKYDVVDDNEADVLSGELNDFISAKPAIPPQKQ